MKSGVGPNEAALLLKTDPAYNGPYLKRFAGNVARAKAGLNQLSEAEYIALENQYTDLMSAYGVKDAVIKAIRSEKYDFICLNFANGDMVGHTGVYKAIEKLLQRSMSVQVR
jgi:hypothetical protein